jgi:hypothetical protein
VVEVARLVAVPVDDDAGDADGRETDRLGRHVRLLEDLAHGRVGGVLAGVDDAGDRRPRAGVGTADQEDVVPLRHDGGDAGEPERGGADRLAEGQDEVGRGHGASLPRRAS